MKWPGQPVNEHIFKGITSGQLCKNEIFLLYTAGQQHIILTVHQRARLDYSQKKEGPFTRRILRNLEFRDIERD